MTIESLYEPDIYQGNDTADTFTIGFKYTSTAHVKVTEITDATGAETELVLNTDFTLSGDGSATAGSLTLTAGALATGKTLVIELDIPTLQATDFGNQGGFFPANHTAAFDKVTQILQIHDEKIARSVKTAIVGDQTADELRDTLVDSAAAAAASAADAAEQVTLAEAQVTLANDAKDDAVIAKNAAQDAQSAAEAAAASIDIEKYNRSFANADLAAGVLTVTHNLNSTNVSVVVLDNNGKIVLPDEVTVTSANALTVSLVSFGTLSGTWSVKVVA